MLYWQGDKLSDNSDFVRTMIPLLILESERRNRTMALHQRSFGETTFDASPAPPGRGRWSRQRAAQGAWIVFALVLLVNFVVNIPAYYQSARTGCTEASAGNCETGLLSIGNVQALTRLHLSVAAVAIFLATLTLAVSVLYWVVGFLVFWRKSQEWMGLFVSFLFVMNGAIGIGAFPSPQTPPFFQLLTAMISIVLLGPIVFAFLFTFPTGRFTPRWTWFPFLFVVLVNELSLLPQSSLPILAPLLAVGLFLTYLLMLGVQIYRYVRVYDAVQRQQTKWFVYALVVIFSFLGISDTLGALVPGLSAPDSWYQLLNALTWLLVWTALLLGVSIPILRYRLWDIDVIINRTLIYGSLTVLLAGIYIGLILALQALVRDVTGSVSQQPLALVISTLVIAALFQPLRHRIQTIIDRRFYRRKYDAARVVAAFSSTLRTEVDVDTLREQLLAVVQETMQPTHVSLWVRQPSRAETPSLQAGKPSLKEARIHEESAGYDA